MSKPGPPKVRFPIFLMISGTGWLIDMGLMLMQVQAGVPVVWANMISAALAVSFVFAVAQKRVFFRSGVSLKLEFCLYLLWHVVFIMLASVAIAAMSAGLQSCGFLARSLPSLLCTPLEVPTRAAGVAKVLITPATVYLNFVFMSWLIEKKISWI